MRTETVVTTDDMTGEPDAETITFGFLGSLYTIDLTAENIDKLSELLMPYIEAAHRISGKPKAQERRHKPSIHPSTIRAWAFTQGIQLGNRGRIPQEVVAAYQAAQ